MASVTFEGVVKAYDEVEVIRGVDLHIDDGEFLVLVGPSGCGKSTMMRMVAGLEDVTRGKLAIGDRVVNDVAPRDRGVAMVFQSYALYPHMSVFDNMAFGLKIRRTPRPEIEARVGEAARMLGLEPLLDRLPRQMSGGQRQRVAIGRAIVRDPQVFLFDEPLSNLDAALRTDMRVELKKLHRRLGTTMIYVTHDQVEAMTLADRIAVLDKGIVQQHGSPAEIYDKPANAFVARFIGSPSMNFLRGTVERDHYRGPGFALPLAPGVSPASVGIRPQHVELGGEGDGDIEAVVDVVEPMGWEAYVHAHVGDQALVAHVDIEHVRDVRHGDTLTLHVAPDRLHLFDERDERIDVEAHAP